MSVFYEIYGARVVSNIPLPGLAISGRDRSIDLRLQLNQRPDFISKFSAPPDGYLYTSLDHKGEPLLRVSTLMDASYFVFEYVDGVRFAVERQGREIWGDWPEDYTLEDACTYLTGPVIAFTLRLRGITCLHASAVAINGRGIALMGMPGAGKSTTAAAFAMSGFPVLADDVAVLSEKGTGFLVQPGYPRVNLWPDSVSLLFGAEDALPRITPTWDKRYLPLGGSSHKFQSEPLPLGAIYVLGEREPDLSAPLVEEFAGIDAFMALVSNTYVNYLLDADMRSREFEVLGRIMATVPVRRVRPARDSSKVIDLSAAIAADAQQVRIAVRKPLAAKID